MKLIFCPHCQDVVRLREEPRKCHCGRAWGRYTNGARATFGGTAVPLGIINHSLRTAIMNAEKGLNRQGFEAFVMPKGTSNFQPERPNQSD